MKQIGLIALLLVIVAALLTVATGNGDVAREVEANKAPQIAIGDQVFDVEIADSYWERVRGLSGREFLPQNRGLLFVFPSNDFHGIWMKEMKIAIDIIWFNESLEIVGIKRNATPESYPEVFYPEIDARYVLEVPTNSIGDNVKIGDNIFYYPQQ